MTVIYCATNDQVLTATRMPKISCNNQNTVKLHVDFDATWNGYAKSAVFYTSKDPTPYEVIISSDGNCLVPAEVLIEEATLYIGVRGVKTASREIKSTAPVKYRVLAGTPATVISDPTPSVYLQLLEAYNVERARMNNLLANSGAVTNDEMLDVRVGVDGTTYDTAGEAVRKQTTVAPSLASFILGYPGEVVIDADAETITFPDDTLIVGYGGKNYQLTQDAGNTSCSYNLPTSAVNVVYQVSTGTIFVQAYNLPIDRRDQILLCSIRRSSTRPQVSISCNYNLIMSGMKYDSLALHYGARRSSFIAPLITGYADKYAVIDTTAGTITFPDDTLIIDPCGGIGGSAITYQLSEAKGNTVCRYMDYTTSTAVKIFYNPETDALEAAQYNVYNAAHLKLILVATIRTSNKAVAINVPCVVDGLLNGVDYSEWFRDSSANTIKSVNHRGYSDAPENTLSAYRLSKKKGFTYVECDVSFTSDGHAVLLHDDTVDRTSNGTGKISELTLAAVRALDFGSWKSEEYAGEQIPTFEEFIALCKHLGLHPYIELKAGTEDQIKGLVSTVKRYGMRGEVTWISFRSNYLMYVKSVDTKARLGYVVDSVTAATINIVKQRLRTGYNEVFIDCSYGNATAAVQLCVDADIPLEVWTVNSESDILALDPYVSGVTSDNLIAGKLFYDNSIGG